MKNINDLMPRIPGMVWGAITNIHPTNAKLKMMNQMLPHDRKWHTIFEDQDQVHVDGVTIKRKSLDSMT